MMKFQHLRQDDLSIAIATTLNRVDNVAYYRYTLKHPSDRFKKHDAIDELLTREDRQIHIDDSLTRNELLLTILCDIYAMDRLFIPKHYKEYIRKLIAVYASKDKL